MTISYKSNSSASQFGINTYLFRQPDVVDADDYALLLVVNKYPGSPPDVPTGYSLLAYGTGGSGAAGADVGQILISVMTRICDGSEDAATEAMSVPGGNSVASRTISYSRNAGSGWVTPPTTFGLQSTASDNWSVTSDTTLDLAAGDILLGFVGKAGDGRLTHGTTHTLSMSGITFSAVTPRIGVSAALSTTNGDDCAMHAFEATVTSGSANGTLSATIDWSGGLPACAGGILFVRLRELVAGNNPGSRLGLLGVG